jgi:hypothetical protein
VFVVSTLIALLAVLISLDRRLGEVEAPRAMRVVAR